MPSPTVKKRKELNNQTLINICKRQKKIINRKRAIISRLKKQKIKKNTKKTKI